MKRQTTSFLASALLLTASATQVSADPFSGFYTGVSIGGEFTNGCETVNDTATMNGLMKGIPSSTASDGPKYYSVPFSNVSNDDALSSNLSSRHDQRKNRFAGAIFAGYAYSCESYFIAAELFAKGSQYKTKTCYTEEFLSGSEVTGAESFSSNGDPWRKAYASVIGPFTRNTETRTKLNPVEFGIDLRPGFLLSCDSLLYARIGVAFNRLRTNTRVTNATSLQVQAFDFGLPSVNAVWEPVLPSQTITTPVFATTSYYSKNKNVGAFRIGGGLEQCFCDCYYVRLEYTYAHYGKICATSSASPSFSHSTPNSSPLGAEAIPSLDTNLTLASTQSRKVKVTSNVVQLGLSYYW